MPLDDSDISVQRRRLAEANVPIVSWISAASPEDAVRSAESVGCPVIVRSLDGSSARIAEYPAEAALAWRKVVASNVGGAIVEAERPCERYHAMGILDGRGFIVSHIALEIREPLRPYAEFLVASVPLTDHETSGLAKLMHDALGALRPRHGSMRVAFQRRGGNFLMDQVDLTPESLSTEWWTLLADGPPDGAASVTARAVAIAWIPARPGRLTRIEGLATARCMPGVLRVSVRAREGDIVGHAMDATARDQIGFLAVAGDSPEAALRGARAARDAIRIVTHTVDSDMVSTQSAGGQG